MGAGLGGLLAACSDAESTTTTKAAAASPTTAGLTASTTAVTASDLEPVVPPTLPATIPGYTEVDPATGLHVTGTPKVIDVSSYHLAVSGMVANELSLAYDDLRRLPKVTITATTECPGVFTDTTTRSGVPLHTILEMAGVQPGAKEIKMTGADDHWSLLDLNEAVKPNNFLAYEWMGQTLPVLQGFPLRAVLPDKIGNDWVKWLLRIEVQ